MSKKKLGVKIALYCVAFALILTLVLASVGYSAYKNSLLERYEVYTRSLLDTAKSAVDGDGLWACMQQEDETGSYLKAQQMLCAVKQNSEISYIYIVSFPDPSTHKKMNFVMNGFTADEVEEDPDYVSHIGDESVLGEVGDPDADFDYATTKAFWDSLYTSPGDEALFYVNDTNVYGYQMTGYEPGDFLYLYTDGVTEAADADYELYGEERLLNFLNTLDDLAPRELLEKSAEELDNPDCFEDDPLHEGNFSPVPYLVHKYPDRAAFFICNSCFMFCRHCTRKNTVIKDDKVTKEQFEDILDYLRKTPQIRDVLVTGDDPFTLSDEELDDYLSRLRAIEHIQTLRIGTRAIVVQPQRITEKLADMLAKHHPSWINTHFNHPSELTPEAAKACDILLRRGIPLGNQTVLLKGVNDDIDTMEQLVLGLIRMRVRPYYLYQCDCVRGTSHFHTPYQLGMDIIRELRRRVSGYAVPHFVIDVPGPRGGKITVEHSKLIEERENQLLLRALDSGEVAYDFGGCK